MMRFKIGREKNTDAIMNVLLFFSLGAIFLQIWILMSTTEDYLQGKYELLWVSALLSGIALACCALTAWTTTLDFFKKKENE